MNHADFKIRTAISSDIPFLYDSWLKSYKHDSAFGKSVRSGIFFNNYRLVLDSILKDESTIVSVACHPTEPNVIFGYLVSTPSTIHYVFVKEAFRQFGIATALLATSFEQGVGVYATHKTTMVEPLLEKYPAISYNPFQLFAGVSQKKEEEHNA